MGNNKLSYKDMGINIIGDGKDIIVKFPNEPIIKIKISSMMEEKKFEEARLYIIDIIDNKIRELKLKSILNKIKS